MTIGVILLAAGASSRMLGTDKALLDVHGVPMLRHCAMAALASKAERVIVVLPPERPARYTALQGLNVALVDAPDWREGMAESIRAGLAAAMDCDAVILALADMPMVTFAHFDRLIAAFQGGGEICRAMAEDGRVGHPVLFAQRYFGQLASLAGDKGGREVILAAKAVIDVPTPGQGAVLDIDTAADWAAWR